VGWSQTPRSAAVLLSESAMLHSLDWTVVLSGPLGIGDMTWLEQDEGASLRPERWPISCAMMCRSFAGSSSGQGSMSVEFGPVLMNEYTYAREEYS
jgi:hypothetical protein